MEEFFDYKLDIIRTRTGNVGSSDARMLQQIAELGQVPKSAYKRMAVIKGLAENEDVTTPAIRFGDYIESQVFENLKAKDERWQSNPCVFSKKYKRTNVGCLTHIDFLLQDDENKTLTICECKATKLSFEQARHEYAYQICHHFLLAQELAKSIGGYKIKIMLCVYDTNDVDYNDHEFDPSRLTVKQLRNIEKEANTYRLSDAMDIVNDFLETFTEYYEGDEIESEYLPEKVKQEFDTITTILAEIKERETKVEEFKTRLYEFMLDKNIKGIRSEEWSITRVDASKSKSFDGKKYLADLKALHPRKAKKIEEEYTKTIARGGYVKILVRKDNKS